MVKPQTVRYRLIKQTSKFWKYSRIWKISLDSNLNCFTRYKSIVIQKDSWININEWFGCNFPTWNIRNVWRARDDGHHYDVTSKCCGVTITRLVEWTLSISEIRVFFCCFQELSGFKKYKWLPKIKSGIKAKRHGRSVLRNYLTTRSAVGAKNPRPSVSGFLPPPWTSWWVNCAIPTAQVVSL